jgi:hypothetical protein
VRFFAVLDNPFALKDEKQLFLAWIFDWLTSAVRIHGEFSKAPDVFWIVNLSVSVAEDSGVMTGAGGKVGLTLGKRKNLAV